MMVAMEDGMIPHWGGDGVYDGGNSMASEKSMISENGLLNYFWCGLDNEAGKRLWYCMVGTPSLWEPLGGGGGFIGAVLTVIKTVIFQLKQ